MTEREKLVRFAFLPVVEPVLEVLKEVPRVDLIDRLKLQRLEIVDGVSLYDFAFELALPDLVVYAVVDVDPARLAVGA